MKHIKIYKFIFTSPFIGILFEVPYRTVGIFYFGKDTHKLIILRDCYTATVRYSDLNRDPEGIMGGR